MTPQEVLKIAAAEIGYCEKKTNAQLDNKTANAGSNNYTKYARDLYIAKYWNGNKNGYDWCTSFVAWCIWMAAGRNKEAAIKVQPYGPLGASCKYETGYYKKAERFFSEPKVGDQAFFTRGHTGLVESYDGYKITLIEGNSNNKVERRTYKFPNSQFSGFGRPFYSEPAAIVKLHKVLPTDTPEKIARKYGITTKELLDANREKYSTITIDFIRDGWELIIPQHKAVDTFVAYTATVDATNGLKVRTGPSTDYKQIGVLKYGTKIRILEVQGKWGRHTYNGKDGWSALQYTRK